MPLTIQEFELNLYASGLLTEADVATFRASLDPPPQSADELAHALVKWKRLTMFQARSIYKGKTKRLIVGDYVILEEIGSGGMGEVFKAVHRRMERVVALKVLPEKAFDSKDAIRRFQREVKGTAKLHHENIVTALDAGQDDRLLYLVLEYVDGRDLYNYVAKKSVLSVRQASNVIIQVARGLRHAHNEDVIHRDIKPSNLLLGSNGIVKILDLGLARFVNSDDATPDDDTVAGRITLPGQMLGTAEYVSPEQAEDTHDADARSDIYSLGCTLHYLLTGSAPFDGASVVALVLAHHNEPIPVLRKRRSDVPEELDNVFQRMLAKDPDDRFQNMDELISAMERIIRFLPKDDSPPEDFETRPSSASGDSATLAFESDGSSSPKASDSGSRPETDGGSRHDTRNHSDDVEEERVATGGTRKLLAPQSDLDVARWALGIEGNVMISAGDFCKRVRSLDQLPDDSDLRLEAVMLDYNTQVTDDDLARFKSLKQLRRIFLHGANVGDRGLKHLRSLRNLEQLSIGQTKVTDLGLAYLVTMLNMRQLSLSKTAITDRGLKCLERLTKLRKLALANTQVTPDGVSQLKHSLPDCEISTRP